MAAAPATDPDVLSIRTRMALPSETESVAGFVAGPGIEPLNLRFDIAALRTALEEAPAIETWHGESFRALPPDTATWRRQRQRQRSFGPLLDARRRPLY